MGTPCGGLVLISMSNKSQRRKKSWLEQHWAEVLSLTLSVIALFFSYLSYSTSRDSLEYEIEKDSWMSTPTIVDVPDSISINFKLDNPASELQAFEIIFPPSITTERLASRVKPMRVSRYRLEHIAEDHILRRVQPKDSTINVGSFSIPVIINYSAVVFGTSQPLRENRLLVFELVLSKDFKKISYTNSFLVARSGYPIKGQTHIKWPWADVGAEEIAKQDSLDVVEYLESQLASAQLKPEPL